MKKVQNIKEWESSNTTKGVRSFLGLANLYRKFIKDFLALAKPFFELPTKELSFEWQHEQQSVQRIKEKLSTTHVLKYPNFLKSFEMHTNANEFSIGDVWMQDENPIAFEYKKFVGAQLRWSTHENFFFYHGELF